MVSSLDEDEEEEEEVDEEEEELLLLRFFLCILTSDGRKGIHSVITRYFLTSNVIYVVLFKNPTLTLMWCFLLRSTRAPAAGWGRRRRRRRRRRGAPTFLLLVVFFLSVFRSAAVHRWDNNKEMDWSPRAEVTELQLSIWLERLHGVRFVFIPVWKRILFVLSSHLSRLRMTIVN